MGQIRTRGSRDGCKKKVITPEKPPASAAGKQFKSIFSPQHEVARKASPLFLPPESFGNSLGMDEDEAALELSSASAWDVATRYHEFKARPSMKQVARRLRKISAEAILERAQQVLGSIVHPVEQHVSPFSELPGDAQQPDFDIEETFDQSPYVVASVSGDWKMDYPVGPQDLWMNYTTHRRQPVILSVDTSLSMTGEKLALTAVALAVVLLQFPDDPVGIVAFENAAQILKRPEEKITLEELVERFLDVPAQGYTHLEDGMKGALNLARDVGQGRPISTVLLTDGKYTAGRDPAYLAPRFSHLVVLKMGKERASLELCRELAKKGHGLIREVGELDSLPTVMYGVVKDLLRGRSLA